MRDSSFFEEVFYIGYNLTSRDRSFVGYVVDSVSVCVVEVYREVSFFPTKPLNEVLDLTILLFGRFNLQVYTGRLRHNTDIATSHKLIHSVRSVVLGILVNIEDVSMVYGSITAGSTFVAPGEVEPRSVFEDIASLRPTISLAILGKNILLDGIF